MTVSSQRKALAGVLLTATFIGVGIGTLIPVGNRRVIYVPEDTNISHPIPEVVIALDPKCRINLRPDPRRGRVFPGFTGSVTYCTIYEPGMLIDTAPIPPAP